MQRLPTVTPEIRPESLLRPVIVVSIHFYTLHKCFIACITVSPQSPSNVHSPKVPVKQALYYVCIIYIYIYVYVYIIKLGIISLQSWVQLCVIHAIIFAYN